MFFRRGVKEEHVDASLLGEHFDSIRAAILEIKNFKQKKKKLTPTYTATQKVDIEKAWNTCRAEFEKMLTQLNEIAERFEIEPRKLNGNETFDKAIESFLEQLATVTFGVADALGTGAFTEEELMRVDGQILFIQKTAFHLHTLIKDEFDFSD